MPLVLVVNLRFVVWCGALCALGWVVSPSCRQAGQERENRGGVPPSPLRGLKSSMTPAPVAC